MTNGLADIIKKLEHQWAAIEKALKALREIEIPRFAGDESEPAELLASVTAPRGARKATAKGGMTPEGRKRLSEALKARWAAKRAGSTVAKSRAKKAASSSVQPAKTAPAKAAVSKAKRKGGMTPEGRKRLSEALTKRWAAKRTAAQSKRAVKKESAAA